VKVTQLFIKLNLLISTSLFFFI